MSRKPAARRTSSPPPADPPPPAEGDAASDADTAPPSTPAEPVHRIRIKKPPLLRAGGHVLTERGWQPAATQRSTADEEK